MTHECWICPKCECRMCEGCTATNNRGFECCPSCKDWSPELEYDSNGEEIIND